MVRFFLIISMLVQMVEQEDEVLSGAKLNRELKNIHKEICEYDKLTSEDYRRYKQIPMNSKPDIKEVVTGSSGYSAIFNVTRGQGLCIVPCSVRVRRLRNEKDIKRPLLYKQGSDLPINSYFQHIHVHNIVHLSATEKLVGMLVTFVDVQEDDAGNYTCSLESGREVQIMGNRRLQLEVNSQRALFAYKRMLTEPVMQDCVVYIMDIDHKFIQSDFTVEFEWYRNSKQIENDGVHISISEIHYEFEESLHQFTSFLPVFNITESSYGKYLCKGYIYDQSGNRGKPQFLRMVEKLYYLKPLNWRKQAGWLASQLPNSNLMQKQLESASAQLVTNHQQWMRDYRKLYTQIEQVERDTEFFEDTIWMLTSDNWRLQMLYKAMVDLYNQLRSQVYFWKWVIGIVSSVIVLNKVCQYLRRKFKEREMKRHYALLEKIAALGLTFRHQCSNYDYDVFISSCEDDENFVEDQLLPKIQMDWHLKKYYSEEDELIGVDIISNMSEKIHKSRKTLVVLSQKFLQSSWSVHELCLAYHRKFCDSKDSLVILHLSDLIDNPLELEPLLQGNNYVDFRKGSTGKAWNKLKHALIKGRKKKRH